MTDHEKTAKLVLVADDEVAIRMICRVNLEVEGLEVVEAADGREALEVARRDQPAAIVLDVMLPGLDGFQVADDLLSDPDTADIPIVFLSGRADQEAQVRGLKLGGIAYITKPFDPLELVTTLVRIVREDPREWEKDRRARLQALNAARHVDEQTALR